MPDASHPFREKSSSPWGQLVGLYPHLSWSFLPCASYTVLLTTAFELPQLQGLDPGDAWWTQLL